MTKIECIIIEFLIAIRLGGQFLIQLVSLTITGSVDEETNLTKAFRYMLILGTCLATFIIVRRKLYTNIRKRHIYFLLFLLLYTGLMYYYLFIDDTRTYHGVDATSRFSTVINNVLFLCIVSIAFISQKIKSALICKIIVVLAFISSYLYMVSFGVNFGDAYDGFLLQDLGFSSLQVGYFSGMSLLFTLYLYQEWSKSIIVNRIITFILAITFLYMIVSSGKTGPTIFTFFVMLIACKQMFFKTLSMKKFAMILCCLLLLAIIFFNSFLYIIDNFNPNLATKISNTFLKGDTSNRDFLFEEALRVFNENILWGSYFELKKYGIYPHNFFLENLITWGIVGTAMMVVFLWKAFKTSIGLIQRNSQLVWICYLFYFSFLSAQSTGSLYGNYRFWLSLTILITISNAKYETKIGQCHYSNLFATR